jgi:hypothetical protein
MDVGSPPSPVPDRLPTQLAPADHAGYLLAAARSRANARSSARAAIAPGLSFTAASASSRSPHAGSRSRPPLPHAGSNFDPEAAEALRPARNRSSLRPAIPRKTADRISGKFKTLPSLPVHVLLFHAHINDTIRL